VAVRHRKVKISLIFPKSSRAICLVLELRSSLDEATSRYRPALG